MNTFNQCTCRLIAQQYINDNSLRLTPDKYYVYCTKGHVLCGQCMQEVTQKQKFIQSPVCPLGTQCQPLKLNYPVQALRMNEDEQILVEKLKIRILQLEQNNRNQLISSQDIHAQVIQQMNGENSFQQRQGLQNNQHSHTILKQQSSSSIKTLRQQIKNLRIANIKLNESMKTSKQNQCVIGYFIDICCLIIQLVTITIQIIIFMLAFEYVVTSLIIYCSIFVIAIGISCFNSERERQNRTGADKLRTVFCFPILIILHCFKIIGFVILKSTLGQKLKNQCQIRFRCCQCKVIFSWLAFKDFPQVVQMLLSADQIEALGPFDMFFIIFSCLDIFAWILTDIRYLRLIQLDKQQQEKDSLF